MRNLNVDVLIVGTGVSGLYCALNLSKDLKVLIVTKAKISDSNTYLAQGGISTAKNQDDIPHFIEDTLKAGKFENNLEAVRILATESIKNINKILDFGIKLDKVNNELNYTKEGAHRINRIVHCKDFTGKALAESLINELKNRSNVTIYENTYLIDFITSNNKCAGGILFKDSIQIYVNSKFVVLATGGIGGLFKTSTNQRNLTGDGIYLAMKNNIEISDLNYIQFHPTSFYNKNNDSRRFLISEAIRGEGGKLYDNKGNRFIDELLPRDLVTNAIQAKIEESGVPYVNLDVSFLGKNYLQSRFPSIYDECLKEGIDISVHPIPVSPAQHFIMGGIKVDLDSKTSMSNLYAVGEVSCTGVHGANRLASNSLLEGLVFSKRAAISINNIINSTPIIKVTVKKLYESDIRIEQNSKELLINELKKRCKTINDKHFIC